MFCDVHTYCIPIPYETVCVRAISPKETLIRMGLTCNLYSERV